MGKTRGSISRLAIAFLIGLIGASCTQSGGNSKLNLLPDFTAIFSTRPQTTTHALFLIKLSQRPLLTSLQAVPGDNGKKKTDPALLKAIQAEQDQVLLELAQISKDIKPLYRYRMVLNGVAVVAPIELEDKIRGITNVVYIENSGSFSRPVEISTAQGPGPEATAVLAADPAPAPVPPVPPPASDKFALRNSVKFIGGEEAHQRGIRGQNMRVGIIDTGIDYTHAMFGGAGTEAAYKAIDPAAANPGFPTAKVVGGIDLVGTNYDSASADFMRRIPVMDSNPLDEAGHGSHVAGTVAGHGDGVNTYDGVAPDALLYAIKVFGKEGSTGDAVVIAGLEFAANPKGDADFSDHLDAVNLSLGGGYGEAHILYTEAIQNLSHGGTAVIASAGNSGDMQYIVGAPSVADDALSVAASIDDAEANWKFRAVRFTTTTEPSILVEAIEGPLSKPIDQIPDITGPLVYVGLADKDFDDATKANLKGKVAFIDRGVVAFADKIKRAFDAGSIGVVVANNQDGDPIAMGGEGNFAIPAVMIRQSLAIKLKAEMQKGPVTIAFKTDEKIEKPELIDTITSFSSKGPRSIDALIKPEISAPGYQVISAKMGAGALGVAFSGTSMSAPHMTGVIALLKQAHPELAPAELKSLVIGTAKSLVDVDKKTYPVSRQGSGRVQLIRALDAPLVALPSSLSLGEVVVEAKKTVSKHLELHNISKDDLTLTAVFEGHPALTMSAANGGDLKVASGAKVTFDLRFSIDLSSLPDASTELDGLVKIMSGTTEVSRIPVLVIANKVSQNRIEKLLVHSTSSVDSQGAAVDLLLKNPGLNAGDAYVFNFLGRDGRKEDSSHDPFRSRACDLAASGYRVIEREGASVLQVAVKIYEPLTTWDNCEISVLIDADGDGVPDQELVGIKQDHLKGLTPLTFASVLLDAPKARELRRQFEVDTMAKKPKITENYTPAVVALSPMQAFMHSTVAIIEAPVSALKPRATGELAVRIATSYQESTAVEPDDFLNKDPKAWTKINLSSAGAAFVNMPEKISLAPGQTASVALDKGAGLEDLWIIYPSNRSVTGGIDNDAQSEIGRPTYDGAGNALATVGIK